MDFDLSADFRAFERDLSDVARRQLPFAASLALNATAEEVQRNARKRLERRLDRPTPFTLRAFRVRRASKRRLGASVFAMDAQARYLQWAETGGTRRPEGRAIPVPVDARRNKYGNMPRRALARASASPHTFSDRPKGGGRAGLWRRVGASAGRKRGRRLELVVGWERLALYRPRLGFRDAARKTADARMAGHLDKALRRALATARK